MVMPIPSRLMLMLRTRFWSRKVLLTCLPWSRDLRARRRKASAKNVLMKAHTTPTRVNQRVTSVVGCKQRKGRGQKSSRQEVVRAAREKQRLQSQR